MLPTKKEFFHRPELVKEIIGSREVIEASRKNLVDVVEELNSEQAALFSSPLLPNGYNWQDFLKKGRPIILWHPGSRELAMKKGRYPVDIRKESFGKLKPDFDYGGIIWKPLRKKKPRKYSLVDCIKGAKLFAWTELPEQKQNQKIVIDSYTNIKGIEGHGGKYVCKVPPTDPKRRAPYEFRLESVPIGKNRERFAVWFDLESSGCGCKRKLYDFDFKYFSGYESFCQHEIAAYISIAKKQTEESRQVGILMPFALPAKQTVDFHNKLRSQVMMKDGRRKRPLNIAEITLALGAYTARYGNDAWYARGKFINYNW